jgi:hypothetical protein
LLARKRLAPRPWRAFLALLNGHAMPMFGQS